MTDRIRQIVAALPGLGDVRAVWAEADERVARGDARFAGDLGVALAEAFGPGAQGSGAHATGTDGTVADRTVAHGTRPYGTGGGVWQYRGVFDHLLRLLATTPGPGHCAQAVRLVTAAATGPALERHAASLLAGCQPAAELAAVFTADAPEELRACLLHELVLRGVAVTATPGIAEWAAASPYLNRHPLGRLPLTLSAVEGRPALPAHGRSGSSQALPYGALGPGTVVGPAAPGAAGRVPAAEETTTDARAGRIAAAVAGWTEESHARVEARVFDLAAPAAPRAVPETLLSLGLDCLREAPAGDPFAAVACSPAEAWGMLFVAASTGGAYGAGRGGAYGRLAAWESLAGLAGAAEGAGAGEVEACAGACEWYGFVADTGWFELVAWDLALAAVGADRRRLAVLAATDTD